MLNPCVHIKNNFLSILQKWYTLLIMFLVSYANEVCFLNIHSPIIWIFGFLCLGIYTVSIMWIWFLPSYFYQSMWIIFWGTFYYYSPIWFDTFINLVSKLCCFLVWLLLRLQHFFRKWFWPGYFKNIFTVE